MYRNSQKYISSHIVPFQRLTRLEALGLKIFVKTSGGKGLHVVLPIQPSIDWHAAKKFIQSIAEAMAKARPAGSEASCEKFPPMKR